MIARIILTVLFLLMMSAFFIIIHQWMVSMWGIREAIIIWVIGVVGAILLLAILYFVAIKKGV